MRSPCVTNVRQASWTFVNQPAPVAASIAAPWAAPSDVEVVMTGISNTSARICRHSALLLPPPVARISSKPLTPTARISSSESFSPNATPSRTERVMCGRPWRAASPTNAPRASGSG